MQGGPCPLDESHLRKSDHVRTSRNRSVPARQILRRYFTSQCSFPGASRLTSTAPRAIPVDASPNAGTSSRHSSDRPADLERRLATPAPCRRQSLRLGPVTISDRPAKLEDSDLRSIHGFAISPCIQMPRSNPHVTCCCLASPVCSPTVSVCVSRNSTGSSSDSCVKARLLTDRIPGSQSNSNT